MSRKRKRKRGGQPGNRNARKHGFYSGYMSPREIVEFNRLTGPGNVDPQIASLRIRINSAICASPRNRLLLAAASRLLAKWFRSRCYLDAGECAGIKKLCRDIIKEADLQINKTDRSQNVE